eukprot:TRINITY_DN110828_c0_g1_i1.p1 TRINITY_DN110828_c0_g1~~TRINITY_DN110828_c0_g1_i1.p1  ORF type:complete len:397 (-),score=47.00 TRINITY_DN110828_c0_g1_i1:462-1652(-)
MVSTQVVDSLKRSCQTRMNVERHTAPGDEHASVSDTEPSAEAKAYATRRGLRAEALHLSAAEPTQWLEYVRVSAIISELHVVESLLGSVTVNHMSSNDIVTEAQSSESNLSARTQELLQELQAGSSARKTGDASADGSQLGTSPLMPEQHEQCRRYAHSIEQLRQRYRQSPAPRHEPKPWPDFHNLSKTKRRKIEDYLEADEAHMYFEEPEKFEDILGLLRLRPWKRLAERLRRARGEEVQVDDINAAGTVAEFDVTKVYAGPFHRCPQLALPQEPLELAVTAIVDPRALEYLLTLGLPVDPVRLHGESGDEPEGDAQPFAPLRMAVFRSSDCMLKDSGRERLGEHAELLLRFAGDKAEHLAQDAMAYATSRYGEGSDFPAVAHVAAWLADAGASG